MLTVNRCLKTSPQPKMLPDAYNFIGSIHFQEQKFEESQEFFSKAVELCSKAAEEEQRDLDVYYRNLGLSYEHK